ncbi:MAG: type II toxin-antitoxin system VapC family toxin [Candidatus Binatia bacterium]
MPRYMVDTSALVKYDHPEIGSPRVITIVDNPDNIFFISRVGLVEIHSALARKVRMGELQGPAFQQSLRRFYADLRGRKFRLLRSSPLHERQAIRLLVQQGLTLSLRTLDAFQLAIALWLRDQQQLDHFLCADTDLCNAAQQEGLSVINPEVP